MKRVSQIWYPDISPGITLGDSQLAFETDNWLGTGSIRNPSAPGQHWFEPEVGGYQKWKTDNLRFSEKFSNK
jgi:hypothetical protein